MRDIDILVTWTPYLLEGLGWNIIISVIATIVGMLLGSIFVWIKFRQSLISRRAGEVIPAILRGAPTLFLLFYLAILIPNEISLFDGKITLVVPIWLKAALALTASPLAFTAWNLYSSINFWKGGQRGAAILFIPNCMNGFMITLLASSGASLVGVNELVGRTSTVIKTLDTDYSLILYSYAACLFLCTALVLKVVVRRLQKMIEGRFALQPGTNN